MKRYLYTLSLLVVISMTTSSCASVNKLIEQGRYDRAFRKAIKKLSGKKNKKTKYVKGLETAFAALTKRDLRSVSRIIASDKIKNWNQILKIYNRIESRNQTVIPLLPLVSKDGTVAHFEFLEYGYLIDSHVKGMELSFGRTIQKNLREATKMIATNNSNDWKKVFQIYDNIFTMQDIVTDLGAIKSDEGYTARFPMMKRQYMTTNHVKGIEYSFKKLNSDNLNQVIDLTQNENLKNWEQVYNIYRTIQKRQQLLSTRLPLKSEDGYQAKFKFIKTGKLEKEAATKSADYIYNNAVTLLESSRMGSKKDAQDAYHTFQKTEKYYTNYRDTKKLQKEAYQLGQTNVLIKVTNNSRSLLPRGFKNSLLNFDIRKLNSQWTKYFNTQNGNTKIDVLASFNITDIIASPEQEIVNHTIQIKEIPNGWQYVLDQNGNVMKDTSGNDITVELYRTISADVATITMEKSIGLEGSFIIENKNNNQILLNKRLRGNAVFDEYYVTYQGNINALNEATKRRIIESPLIFPTDEELLVLTAQDLKEEVKRTLSSFRI